MQEKIYSKKSKGHTYYYLQRSYRVKIDLTNKGKTKGSGKSKVKTETIYLGSAASIRERLLKAREPIEVHHRDFGFVSAIYNVAQEIGLVEILKTHIPGRRLGILNWKYFLLAIINRLHHANSKEKMGIWASKTILPNLMDFDASKLNSKSFWYATDDVISESDLEKQRIANPDLENEILTGINDSIFKEIEKKLITNLKDKYGLTADVIFYDTTNFFTYFEEPLRSRLSKAGHNKASKHHLKQIGLAMCVDKKWGIPLYHQLYRGNSHDSKTLTEIISDLIERVKIGRNSVENLILVLDKGNNSEANFKKLKGNIDWIGSLVTANYPELIALPLEKYHGKYKDFNYYQLEEKVMGIDAKLVLTFNDKLARKQKHSLNSGIKKLEDKIEIKWTHYKKAIQRVPKGITNMVSASRYGKYLKVRCHKGKPLFAVVDEKIKDKEKKFGKSLLFSSNLNFESTKIIEEYRSKDKVERGFRLLKDPDLIRWQPIRHWTDSKIRAFAFCCIMSLILIRIMELKTTKANLKMSHSVLKKELMDLKEVVMIFSKDEAIKRISHKSSIQKELWNVFRLEDIKNELTIH